MNVLIFVSTLLMIMTIMTYARLDTFRTSQGFQILFQNYMQQYERAYINEKQEQRYKTTHISKDGKETKKNAKVKASPRLPLRYLVAKKDRDTHPAETQQFTILLKKLMHSLYSSQPFFQQMEQQRPGFLDEIVLSLTKATDALPEERKIVKAGELANLDLGDYELNEVFYKMVRGAPAIRAGPQGVEKKEASKELTEDNGEADIAAIDAMEAEEYKSPEGYVSLLDFITLENVPKIRVFLAPPIVLKAIFNDDAVVEEIIQSRQEIFQSLQNSGDKGNLEKNFKNQFYARRDPAFDEKILDFSISKTNPKKYQ